MRTEHTSIQIDIDKATTILKAEGAAEVYLFGSCAEGSTRSDSDLDLAVRGLPPERFFRAMGQVSLAVSRPLDLIDLDEKNAFTNYLCEKGQLRRVA